MNFGEMKLNFFFFNLLITVLYVYSQTPAFGGISLALRGNDALGAFGAPFRAPAAPILRRLRRR